MKKFFKGLAIAATMLAGAIGFAQESGFGVKGNLSLVMVKADGADEGNTGLGIHVGGFYEYMVSDVFAIQPELVYSRESFTAEGFASDISYHYNQLDINIVPKFYATEAIAIEGVLGYGLGMSVSASDSDGNSATVGDAYSGLTYGLGASYVLENGVGINLRWQGRAISEDDAKFSWNSIQVGASYKF